MWQKIKRGGWNALKFAFQVAKPILKESLKMAIEKKLKEKF